MLTGLHVEGLNVAVGNQALLEDVRFTLAPGTGMQLVGPSGSGKSTLLRSIATLHGAGAGLRLGDDTPSSVGYANWRRRVSYAHPSLRFAEASVQEVLQRPFAYRSSEGAFDKAAAASHLEALGLPGLLKRDPHELSSGQLQRVALLRALFHGPAVALLDEPFAHLDERTREHALEWLSMWQSKGTSLLIASHVRLPFPALNVGQFAALTLGAPFTPGDDA